MAPKTIRYVLQEAGSPTTYTLTSAIDSAVQPTMDARRKSSHGSWKYRLMAVFPSLYVPQKADAERGFMCHTFGGKRHSIPPQLRIAVDLTSYAELAVRLVNTAAADGSSDADRLGSTDAFRAFAADDPHLSGPCTHHDLDALRMLRAELGAIFAAAAERDHAAAAERLNALLVQYPVRPKLAQHGRSRWHLHLDESGSVADRYGAAAVAGLAMIVSQFGLNHLGICAIPACRSVFVDASPGRSSRYCADHCANKANVTAFRDHRRAAAGYSASTATG
jgi:predicted RNA-binding Zn ribbon-like protein